MLKQDNQPLPMTPLETVNWWYKFWWGAFVGTMNGLHRNWEENVGLR